jgi:hypothetical protein
MSLGLNVRVALSLGLNVGGLDVKVRKKDPKIFVRQSLMTGAFSYIFSVMSSVLLLRQGLDQRKIKSFRKFI